MGDFVRFDVGEFMALAPWDAVFWMLGWGVTNSRWAWLFYGTGVSGAGSANLGRLEKRHWVCVGGCVARHGVDLLVLTEEDDAYFGGVGRMGRKQWIGVGFTGEGVGCNRVCGLMGWGGAGCAAE